MWSGLVKDNPGDTFTYNYYQSTPVLLLLLPLFLLFIFYILHKYLTPTYLQDALEFFLHLLDQVERVNAGHSELDPSRSFKFGIEERHFCPSGKVAYNRRGDYILSLNIPLHEAANKVKFLQFSMLVYILALFSDDSNV